MSIFTFFSFRRPLPPVALCLVATWMAGLATGEAPTTGKNHSPPGHIRRVVVQVDLAGKLLFNADGRGVQDRSMQLQGRLEYRETVLRITDGHLRQVLRNINHSTAQLVVGKWSSTPQWTHGTTPLVARWSGSQVQLYGLSRPLSSSDLDIVALQMDPLVLDRLIPTERRGELAKPEPSGQWKVTNEVAGALMSWEVCSHQTLECRVVRRDEARGVVLLEVVGGMLGAVAGATAEATLRGKLNYDWKTGTCTWADFQIEEKRAIGHAAPGLEVQGRIRVHTTPEGRTSAEELQEHLSTIPSQPAPTDLYLAFASRYHGFELMHDRSWKLLVDGPNRTIFRFIRDGDLIAQANIARVRSTERPTLAEFQEEIRLGLGEEFERIVSATEETRDDHTRVYHVVVAGTVQSLPIQWIYTHFRNEQGAVTAVITIDARLVEKHAGFEQQLIGSLRVLPPPRPKEARAAGKSSKSR